MSRNYPVLVDSYTSTRERALKKIRDAARDSDSEVLEELKEETDPKKKLERESNTQAVDMVVSKCLSSYRDGEYSFKQTITMITKALNGLR